MKFCFAIVTLLLSSCGFQLRGQLPTNIKAFSVSGSYQTLQRDISEQLRNIKVSTAATSTNTLVIKNVLQQQKVINIDPTTTVRQYLMVYTVDFVFSINKIARPLQTVVVTEQFIENNARILSSNAELAVIKAELRKRAALKIINSLIYQ